MIMDAIMASAIGGGGLPVVEIATPIPFFEEYAQLTSKEGAALDTALLQGIPFIVKCVATVEGMTMPMNFVCNNVMDMPIAHLKSGVDFDCEFLSGVWNVRFANTA